MCPQLQAIRGTAKLLNVSSAKYGGDWHSVPHTHNHMELFYIVGGKGQFKEALTLELLAEEAHMNKFYLSHTFKQEYGISPINYMIHRRIEESKYLLAETDLSMSQIAQLLGFSSSSYFSQVFRRTQGASPMEYRHSTRSI